MKISNSKKKLAEIINDRCGWRENARWAVQHWNGNVVFTEFNKPKWSTFGAGWDVEGDFLIGCHHEKLKHWNQATLSRDEYFHLYPAPGADGWIEWNGGICPVCIRKVVDIRYREGTVIERANAGCFEWQHYALNTDIVAYRLHKPDHAEQEYPDGIKPTDTARREQTIEQLAADYKAKLEIAQQAQEEAYSRRDEAEAALEKLYKAGLEIGLDIAIASDEKDTDPSPELVITDWRYLQVGDEVEGRHDDRMVIGAVCEIDEECRDDRPFRIHEEGGSSWWVTSKEFRFIRRP